MSNKANVRRKNMKVRKNGRRRPNNGNEWALGNINKPPRITMGLQVATMPSKRAVVRRQYKFRFAVATVGAQTFFVYGIFLYRPYNTYSVVAATPTINSNPSTSFQDMLAVYDYYRVRKILVQYSSAVTNTVALPNIFAGMFPSTAALAIGTSGTAATAATNSLQNSVPVDPHYSCSFTYKVPKVSFLPNPAVATGDPMILAGGWIPTIYATSAAATTDLGLITLVSGDAILPAPITTTYGAIDVVYNIDFLQPA